MATYGIYGGQAAPATTPKKATDVFSGNSAPAVAQGAQPNQATPATGAAVPNPFGAPKPATSAFGPVAPAANPGSFEALLNNAGPARQQNATGSQQAISDMLMPSAGPSRESEAARSAFIKAQSEAQRQGAEQSALAGRVQTGQIAGDNQAFRSQSLGQRRDLENSLAISDGKRNDANRQAGVSAFLQQESLGQQERTSQAQLAQGDRSLAENARQFNTRQEFETWATQEGYKQDEISRAWQSEETAKERTSREGVAFAGLSLDEKRLAQEGSQFASKLDFDKWALGKNLDNETSTRLWQSIENEKSRASSEKVAFAGLSLDEKRLAQDGMQFNSKLDFDKSSLAANLDEAGRARIWQAVENEKSRTSTEKIAFANLAQEDKALAQEGAQFDKKIDFDTWAKGQDVTAADRDRVWQAIENEKGRVFTSAESALDRTLNASQFAETIGLSKQEFGEQIRQFDSKQDFDKWATKAGLDAQAAELVWKSNESDISRKWETGERLSTQDHQINLTRLQGEVDKDKASFAQVLGVQTMEKQAQIDAIAAEQANSYQSLRDDKAMGHDQAMEQMKAGLTAQLEQAGYDHETAIQAADLHARAVEGAQNREMATLEAKAELAYKYNALASEEGISREQIAARREETIGQLSLGLQQLGLDTKKFEADIKSQDFQDRAGMLSTMMELGGENPDVADRASAGFLSLLKEKGMISEEQFASGMTSIKAGAPVAGQPSSGGSATLGGIKQIGTGLNNIAEGNILTGAGQTLAGQVGAVTGVGRDLYSGTKKLFSSLW